MAFSFIFMTFSSGNLCYPCIADACCTATAEIHMTTKSTTTTIRSTNIGSDILYVGWIKIPLRFAKWDSNIIYPFGSIYVILSSPLTYMLSKNRLAFVNGSCSRVCSYLLVCGWHCKCHIYSLCVSLSLFLSAQFCTSNKLERFLYIWNKIVCGCEKKRTHSQKQLHCIQSHFYWRGFITLYRIQCIAS